MTMEGPHGKGGVLSTLAKENTDIPIFQPIPWLNIATQTHYHTLQKSCPLDPSPEYRIVNKHHCFINSRHLGKLICSNSSP